MESILSIAPGFKLPSTMTVSFKLTATNELNVNINLNEHTNDLSGLILSDNTHTLCFKVDKSRKNTSNDSNITLPLQLPKKLKVLNLFDCNIEHIPTLPDELYKLCISGNNILTHIPNELPITLKILSIYNCNKLLQLPNPLPPSLVELIVDDAHITTVPPLPTSMKHLCILDTMVTKLPDLPPNLHTVSCHNTGLIKDRCSLEILPNIPINEYNIPCAAHFISTYYALDLNSVTFLKLYPEYTNKEFDTYTRALYINKRNRELLN